MYGRYYCTVDVVAEFLLADATVVLAR